MPRPLKRGILGASTIILSEDIDKYALMCASNFYKSDVKWTFFKRKLKSTKSLVPILLVFSSRLNLKLGN